MDQFATRRDRGAFFRETSERMDLSAVLVEKDFWVCWALKQLYALDGIQPPLFRGGTSLSKCFRLIERFSEDVDLTLDPADLELGDPPAEETKNQRNKRIKRQRKTCEAKVHGEVRDLLDGQFRNQLGKPSDWSIEADTSKNDPTLIFTYPPGLESGEYASGGYVRPQVALEFGVRGARAPMEDSAVQPFVADFFRDDFAEPTARVVAISPERTFWEKVLLLYVLNHREHGDKLGERCARQSRHLYDVAMIARDTRGEAAIRNTRLLTDVLEHTREHFLVAGVDYDAFGPTTLGLSPQGEVRDELRKDYAAMEEMLPDDTPRFDELMEELEAVEARTAEAASG